MLRSNLTQACRRLVALLGGVLLLGLAAQAQAAPADNFITTWRTTTAKDNIVFPGEGSYIIGWGDGTIDNATGAVNHTYAAARDYDITVSNTITRFNLNNHADAPKLIDVKQWGGAQWSSMERAFYGAENMRMSATDAPDLSAVGTMRDMFRHAYKFNGAIGGWDVGKVTDMESMFLGATVFNQDISGWDVGKVTDMESMFLGATSFNQDLNGWDVGKVKNMNDMFQYATAFNGAIGDWDVGDVTNMEGMFGEARAFNQDISRWNVGDVTNMEGMFGDTAAFNQDISRWNVGNVTNMSFMFIRTVAFNQDIGGWDVGNVMTMRQMFSKAAAFNQDISGWDVGNVKNMNGMFGDTAAAFSQNLGRWYIVGTPNPGYNGATNLVVLRLAAQNSVLTSQGPVYALATEDGDNDNDKFTLTDAALSAKAGTAAGDYSVRIGASGVPFGTANAVMVDVTVVNIPPTADAGDAQTVAEGAAVTLDGSTSTDPEGEALAYAWTHTNEGVALTGEDTASPAFTAPTQLAADAALVFSLTVTDARGLASTADTVTVTVTAGANDAPTADAGDAQTVAEGAAVTLDGSGSSDPEDEDLAYAWTQTGGTPTVTLSNASAASPSFTAPTQLVNNATLVFSLTVTDARNLVSSADTVTITVSAGTNDAPTANAGIDQTVAEGAAVTLDGSGSTDPEGEPLTYAWTQTDGTPTVSLSDAGAASPSFTAPTQLVNNATLEFSLTVTDARNLVSSADTVTITVTVSPPPPTLPTSNDNFITTWRTTTANDIITFPGEGTYTIDWGDGTTDNASGTTIYHTYATADDYDITVSNTITRFNLNDSADSEKLIDIKQWGNAQWTSMQNAFAGASNMQMSATDRPNLAAVGDMSEMFADALAFNGDISDWKVGNVTNMRLMFYRARAFNQNISDWKVGNVTNMRLMFAGARAFNQDIGGWDVSKVTDMHDMFVDTFAFIPDLGRWYIVATVNPGYNGTADLVVLNLAAQNRFLTNQGPVYALVAGDGDNDKFTLTTAGALSANAGTAAGIYKVRIGASGAVLFGSVNVTTVDVTVGAPTANAGEDQTVAEGAAVTLDGSTSTDPEGETLTYAWTQSSGTEVSLSDAGAASPSFTAPTQLVNNATLEFSLTVTDASNLVSTADTVTITVTAGTNDAPTANAGEDKTVAEGAAVTLDGSTSTDPEDETLTYAWTHTNEGVALTGEDTASPAFTAPTQLAADAALVFSLTVTDARGLASTAATVTITVTAGANDAPTADAGAPQTVAEGAAVTLDGSGSSDPEDETLTYAWTHTNEGVTLTGGDTASPAFTAPTQLVADAALVFSLTVTDARGLASTAAATVTITVTAGANDAPTADAGAPQTVAEGAAVTLNGSGSSDPEDETLTYAWTHTNEGVTLTGGDTASPAFTAPTQLVADATLVFSLTVTDARGLASTAAATVTITVTAGANDAPTADAGAPQTVAEGAAVTLNGSGSSDPEDETLTYAWTHTNEGVTLTGGDTASPAFTAPTQLVADAALVFSLTVTDARGLASTAAATVTITVTAGANDAPTADAGAPQTVAEGAAVTLNGSGSSDPEDETLTYAWTHTNEGVTLTGGDTASPAFTAPTQLVADATLVFSLTVTDARGLASTAAATVTITVTAGANDAPTADAGAPQTVAEGAAVTLNGSGSSDPEDETLTYAWTHTNEGVTLTGGDTASPAFTAPTQLVADATLVFSLTVTDARGLASTAAATVTITVTAGANDAPTADAGDDQTVAEGAAVTLNGSGSSDPEDETLTYAWTHTNEGVTLTGGDTASPAFTAPTQLVADATLVFSLTVTDARGLASTAAATVTITVTAGANDAPTADAGAPQTVAEGAAVTLNGSGSSDPEDETLTYAWTHTNEGVTLTGGDTASPAFTAPTQLVADAALVFSLTVTDARGLVSIAATVTVTVTAGANDAPTADAGAPQTVAEGAAVTLDGSGSGDPEGEALAYAWTHTNEGVTLTGEDTASPAFAAPTQLAMDATLVFSLTVTDARGLASTAATVTVTVTAGANDAPTADAGAPQTVAEGAAVTLDGSGSSDPEDETLTYAWTHTNEGVTLTGEDTASPAFAAPTQLAMDATLVFSLIVTDARGLASIADTVTITVSAGDNDAPTADAGDAQTVAEGAAATLDGSGSSDPEGEALAYAWTHTNEGVALTGEDTASPAFAAPTQLAADATLVFSLTVTDARGLASTAATVTVTVTAGANDAPTADAGDDQTVAEGAAATLDGSGSSDPEDETLAYAWTHTNEGVTLTGGDTASPAFTAPTQLAADAALEFSLTVTDARGLASIADTVTITVSAGDNDAPTADAGDAQTVAEGAAATLDGSGSSDPEGEALAYAWTHTNEGVALTGEDTASPAFTAPTQLAADAALVFSLTVTDARGLASTADTVTITVTAGANDAPTADAGDDQTVDEGDLVTLDGSASRDPEGEALAYAWTHTNEGLTLTGEDTASPAFTAPTQLAMDATLVFSLIVTDARGLASIADTVTITVSAGDNDAPTADAGDDQTVDEGDLVTLDGSASRDPEGEALAYAWTHTNEGVTLTGEDTASPAFTAPTQLAADAALVFSLTVTDARGLASTADTVTVTVTAGANDAPTADAGAPQTVAEGAAVTLDGSGSSDPEDETLTYAWTHTNEGLTLTGEDTASPAFAAPTQLAMDATLEFSLTVTDARGLASTAAATVTITVTAGANGAPTADAGAPQTVAEGAAVTLNGSGSSDPEDETLTYAWTHTNEGVTLTGEDTASPAFAAPTQLAMDATLEFSLTVTDARGLASTAAATVTVTVTAGANDAPTADAGAPQTVAEGAAVTLNGSGSSDTEDETLTYAWTHTNEGVALTGEDTASPAFAAPTQLVADAALVFSLTVTDARGLASIAATVTVTVTAGANDAPTADAGDAQTVAEGAAVTLDGSSSSDPEGEALAYAWTHTNEGVTLTGEDTASPAFAAPVQLAADAALVFSLTVTDARGLASTAATVTVTVTAGANDAPTADAGDDQTVAEGAAATLDGSGSSDPEDETLAYAWTHTNEGVTLTGGDTASPAFTAPTQLAADATLVFSLTVTDARGLASIADTVTITVSAGDNDAPTADAGDAQTVAEGAAATLDGSGSSDPEGEALAYAWTHTNEGVALTGEDTASPAFTAPTQLAADAALVFSLTVTDARGLASTADTVTITVTAGANDAPTADAGDDQTVDEGDLVTLDGSASRDPEGEALAYAWTHTNEGLTLTGEDTASPAFTAPTQLVADATLVFSLTVTDARGLASTAAATVTITVTAGANDAPTADAGAPQTVAEGAAVTLNGSGSSDPEDETLTYAWTHTNEGVTLTGGDTASPAFTAPTQLVADAALVFSLTVTDARGLVSIAATVTVTVTAGANDAPTADAGAPQTVAEGAAVTLDGSGSGDPEGEALAYAWTHTNEGVTLTGEDTASPAFAAPTQLAADATLEFSLTVTDARGLASTAAATVTITVTAGANGAPTADAGAPQTVAEGAAVTLNGSGSSDPEDETLTYAWTHTNEGVALTGEDTASPAFTAPTQLAADAALVFSLTVTDARGLASTADTVTVTVTAGANDAPTADAGAPQTVAEGAAVTLDGSGSSDPEDETLTYAWTHTNEGVTLTGGDTASPAFTAPTQLAADAALVFSLTVTDARGLVSIAATVTVTVTAGANDAPTADAGAPQTVAEGAAVTLDGSGSSDTEDETLTYAWTHTNEGVTLTGGDTASPAFTAPTQLVADATLVFSLTVTDARGLASTAAATVTITVTAGANDAPTADAGAPQTVAEGAAVTLDGSGSSDPEDETLTYAWTHTNEGVTLTGEDTASPAFAAPVQLAADATLVFSLTVTDARGLASAAATVTVTVTAGANDAPTADAGDAQTVAEGAAVTLDGSGSGDPEGEALAYAWTHTNEGVTLTGEDTASPAFAAPTQLAMDATLEFSLTVTDARGLASTAAATVTVTVTAGANDAPTADAGAPQTVAEGAAVTLDGSGSSDPEDETLTYAWTHTNEGVTLTGGDTASPAFTAPTQLVADAALVFSLTVTDARGLASTAAATVTITVTAGANDAPTADAGAPQTVAEGAAVTLNGSGSSDPEDETLTYAWTHTNEGVTLTGGDTASPAFTAPTQLVADATLVFSLTVTDARGLASTADTVTITVVNLTAPIISASAATLTATAGTEIPSVTITSSGGAVASYSISPDIKVNLGLEFDPTTGAISGAPTAEAVEITYTITATNIIGTATATVAITVTGSIVLSITEARDLGVLPPRTDATGSAITLPTRVPVNVDKAEKDDFTVTSTLNSSNTDHEVTNISSGSIILTVTPVIPSGTTIQVSYAQNLGAITNNGNALVSFSVDVMNMAVGGFAPSISASLATLTATAGAEITPVTITSSSGAVASYSIAPAIGNGLSFSTSTGAISGTPLAAAVEVIYTITATNVTGTATATVAITVTAATETVFAALNDVILPEMARAISAGTVSAITQRIGQAGSAPRSLAIGGQRTLAGALSAHGKAMAEDRRDFKEMLAGSDFVLPLNAGDGATGGSSLTLWGSGEYRKLSSKSRNIKWDGDLTGAHLGFDARIAKDVLAGLAVSWLKGDLDYKDSTAGFDKGDYEIDLVSAHPYIGWRAGQLDLWATVGYGNGEVAITRNSGVKHSSDINQRTIGVGGSGKLWQGGASRLRLKGEALQTAMEVEGGAGIAKQDVDATRLRMTAEASQSRVLAGGGVFEPSVEAGVRYDGGDGETGSGAEVGGRLSYRNPATGVTAEGRVRALLGHSGGYEEWGVQGSLALQTGADGQGLSFSLSPGYGDSGGGVQQLWRQGLPAESVVGAADYSARLDARLGYGLSLRERDGVLTPYGEMTLGATDSYRIGLNWKAGSRFDLTLLGERRESDSSTDDHAILLKGYIRF